MEETTKSIADATAQVAKTTSDAIKATERLGSYIAPLIREPLENVIGILSDKLRFMRWTRQLRLADKIKAILDNHHDGVRIPIPPKLALPMVENASLEEDDYLQDMWARLIVASGFEDTKKQVRTAYIEIIKQLEIIDAKLLHAVFLEVNKRALEYDKNHHDPIDPTIISYNTFQFSDNLDRAEKEKSIDNLFRLRCIRSAIEDEDVEFTSDFTGQSNSVSVPVDQTYYSVVITRLGYDFVSLCLG